MHFSIGEEGDALKRISLIRLIALNCLMAWLVDLKEEDLSWDDVIKVYFKNFFDPTFTKKSL